MLVQVLSIQKSSTVNPVATESLPGYLYSPSVEQAQTIIRNYFEEEARLAVAREEIPARLSTDFYAWLDDPRGRREKERALDRLMEWHSGSEHNDNFSH